jgi:hypothetical protein
MLFFLFRRTYRRGGLKKLPKTTQKFPNEIQLRFVKFNFWKKTSGNLENPGGMSFVLRDCFVAGPPRNGAIFFGKDYKGVQIAEFDWAELKIQQ